MCLVESDFKKFLLTLSHWAGPPGDSLLQALSRILRKSGSNKTYLAPEPTLMELNRPYRFVWYLDILEIWAKVLDQPLCHSDVMERSANPHLRRFLSNHKDSGDKESSSQLPTGTKLCKTSKWRQGNAFKNGRGCHMKKSSDARIKWNGVPCFLCTKELEWFWSIGENLT